MPHRVPARNAELNALDEWIDKGNTLLIMAALDDTPRWAVGGGEAFLHSLGRMTRIQFEVRDSAADGSTPAKPRRKVADLLHALEPRQVIIEPKGSHSLLDGVHSVLAVSEFPASHWRGVPMDASPALDLAHREADEKAGIGADPAIWLKPQLKGQILIFSVGSPFTNRAIAERDNARLFSNIVAWSVRRGGTVIFDDAHQGAVSYYDAKAFFRDPRLHRPSSGYSRCGCYSSSARSASGPRGRAGIPRISPPSSGYRRFLRLGADAARCRTTVVS